MGDPTASKNVIVTGAAGGMGTCAIRQLAERDVNVLCVDRDEEALRRLEAELPAHKGDIDFCVADVSRLEDVQRYVAQAAARWDGLDGVFHLAGWEGGMVPFLDTDIDMFDVLMQINARSVWYGMKTIVPHLLARGGGSIVNTGSYVASHGTPRTAAYGAAKHAVVGMSRGLAIEHAADDIRVNVLAPGATDTRMIRTLWANTDPANPDSGMAKTLSRIPRGKLAPPEEVAQVGVWLLIDAPRHMTGQIIGVDGGRSI
jgi:NAD(P)-dependent dehydrogenase (short-subunit alcohol dehydrogenase family)